MRKKEGFVLRQIANEAVVVGESLELIDFDRLVSLNASAAYIWEAIDTAAFDVDSVSTLLTKRYEVDKVTATNDAIELLNIWLEAGIIEE